MLGSDIQTNWQTAITTLYIVSVYFQEMMKAEEEVKMKGEMEERVSRELEEKIFNIVSTQDTIMYALIP